ncbi:MAG: hypothetical protein IAF94_02915 [Pirellulaceae bacterium]|nr:hypothetical protein [Pirellulaceae bacterium]
MPSLRPLSTLAVRCYSGLVLATLAGCCCNGPVCPEGDGSFAGGGGHTGHPRVLRHGTLSPPVPAPAVASPIPRYHPLPTHPVFETQPQYLPLTPLSVDPSVIAPKVLPEATGEPTPAPLPVEPAK